jgi:hypothetical protein
MRVLAMQQPLAAQQILGKIFECLNRKKQVNLAVFPYYFTKILNNVLDLERGKSRIYYLVKKSYDQRISKKYELFTGNLSEALPVLGAGMKTSVEVFPGHLEVGTDNFHAFFFLTSFIFFS